jgi:DNA-binding beta-propeller fold protein YncE
MSSWRGSPLRVAMVATVAGCLLALALGGDASGASREPPPVAPSAGGADGGFHPLIGFEPVPRSVATDGAGDVYLSNPQGNGQIQRFTSNGKLLARWGHFGHGRDSFPYPRAIAADATGNVYVAESSIGRIRVFTPNGGPIREWSASALDVATDAAGYVYAISSSNLQKFTPDGTLVAQWGSSGFGDGQFGEPWGIAAGSGNVYVADTYAARVEVFTADGSFVGAWGNSGKGLGQLGYPYGIATDPAGNVYVADTTNDRIQKFTPGGVLITAWGSIGRRPGHFILPTSVATDPAGNVYVADAGEGDAHSAGFDAGIARVQKFTPNGQFITQWRGAPALILAKPKLFSHLRGGTTRRTALFRFRSRQRGIYFQCRLRGERVPGKLGAWRRCVSPQRYAGLRPGVKSFQVRVFKDLEPGRAATRWWRIVKRRRHR